MNGALLMKCRSQRLKCAIKFNEIVIMIIIILTKWNVFYQKWQVWHDSHKLQQTDRFLHLLHLPWFQMEFPPFHWQRDYVISCDMRRKGFADTGMHLVLILLLPSCDISWVLQAISFLNHNHSYGLFSLMYPPINCHVLTCNWKEETPGKAPVFFPERQTCNTCCVYRVDKHNKSKITI